MLIPEYKLSQFERDLKHFRQHPIVLFGTLNNKIELSSYSWMTTLTAALMQRGIAASDIYNPESTGNETRDISKESFNLTNPNKITVINFESQHGRTSLAEARIAFLVAAITGTQLIINFQTYSTDDQQSAASREILRADIETLSKIWQSIYGIQPNIQIIINNDDMEVLADSVNNALNKSQETLDKFSSNENKVLPKNNQIILTTSGNSEQERNKITETLELINYDVVDTNDPHYDTKGVYTSRVDELNKMLTGVLQLVIVNQSEDHESRSPLGHVMTCLIISFITGGRTVAVIPESLRKSDFPTIMSHLKTLEELHNLELPIKIVTSLEETELYHPEIALFGTNTSITYQNNQTRWFSTLQARLLKAGFFAYEPTTDTLAQRRISDEVTFITTAKNILFNIGPVGGNVTLAEIRLLFFAIFNDKRKDRKVIINIEKTTDPFVERSRRTLLTDLAVVKYLADNMGIPFNIQLLTPSIENPENQLDIELMVDLLTNKIKKPSNEEESVYLGNVQDIHVSSCDASLSGPLIDEHDLQLRDAVCDRLRSLGITVVDTHDPDYDKNPVKSRIHELLEMAGKNQYILINESRLSKFGPAFTSALMGYIYRKTVTFLVPRSLMCDNVTISSFEEHLASLRTLLPKNQSSLFKVIYFENSEDLIRQL